MRRIELLTRPFDVKEKKIGIFQFALSCIRFFFVVSYLKQRYGRLVPASCEKIKQ